MKKKIPSDLQAVLWSKNTSLLDLRRDKNYIIHQALRYGTLTHLRWLFKTYSKKDVREIFVKNPIKIYSRSSLKFAKNFVLNLDNKYLNENRYLASSPRRASKRRSRFA